MQAWTAAEDKRGWQRLAGSCLLYWHLCSLDAPSIAIVWSMTLQRLAGVRPHPPEILVLALGTWIVYVLDRVLDGAGCRQIGPGRDSAEARRWEHLQDRHYFHRRHRKTLLRLSCLATLSVALLCFRLPPRLVEFYLLLGVPVLLYGLLVHRRLLGRWRGIAPGIGLGRGKEAAVAALFTAAVAGPSLVGAEPACRSALLLACLQLALLCWLNCALITYGEALAPTPQRRKRLAALTVALLLAAAAVCGRGLGRSEDVRFLPAAAAVLLSCLLLLLLLLGMRDAPARRLRVLADFGLLTPLLFLLSR